MDVDQTAAPEKYFRHRVRYSNTHLSGRLVGLRMCKMPDRLFA